MKHLALEQLQVLEKTDPDYPRQILSRNERIERWAELLERNPARRLTTLYQTEFQSAGTRDAMRADGSALTVAFEDSYLRGSGLSDDSYGEAKRFFELNDHQLHRMVCYCHFGANVSAGTTARYVRRFLPSQGKGMIGWLRQLFAV
ncbi:hypothetical protein SAMN05428967_3732 [Phyllobacterium sp. YR620]|uniref:hypothetical protein n=1 Tax=Phyllobacterium sp. YR620 TaxID=1881066 RepID=UPI000882C78A|nr:hypothetical protein [Phyllobacterium sp. YR620]SDP83988.1 hypothetical protein SAMN05428967_3732 [Phyllobacterium sp. YR620]